MLDKSWTLTTHGKRHGVLGVKLGGLLLFLFLKCRHLENIGEEWLMKQRCEEVEGDAVTFRWNDHTYAWRVGGRNRITCAPMDDSPPSHQQKGITF